MAAASPSYALFTGAQYLYRGANDTTLDAGTTFSVSVTVDPESFGHMTSDAVVAGKIRTDNNQRSWVVEYIASSGRLKLTVFGAADGTIYTARESSTAIRYRRNVTFTCSASGTINVYLDGTLDNGTATSAGSFSGGAASTERFAIGARDTSGTPTAAFKGSVHLVAVFAAELTSGDISGMSGNGLLVAAMASHGSLRAYWKHDTVAANSASDLTAWVDTAASLALTAGVISGSIPVKAQAPTGTAILIAHLWRYTLTDNGLGTTALTTGYTSSNPYRLWVTGQPEPQIASGFRDYTTDFTVTLRTRNVLANSQSDIFRQRGIRLRYIDRNELFLVVGDDNVGSTNKRLSWGFNLFPIGPGTTGSTITLDSLITLRYNAVERDADIFIGGVLFAKTETLTGQTISEITTGVFNSQARDFVFCAYAPAALSDAQVLQFITGLSPLGRTSDEPSINVLSVHPDNAPPKYGVVEGTVWPPDAIGDPNWPNEFPLIPTVPITSQDEPALNVLTYESPYTPKDRDPDVYAIDERDPGDPLPVILSASLSITGAVTAIGEAGPYQSPKSRTWWEITVRPNEFSAVGTPVFGRDFFNARRQYADAFQAGPDFNAEGTFLRFAVQPQLNAGRIYYSAPFALAATPPVNPNPAMVSVLINSAGQCIAVANAGPTDAGNFDVWFEVEQTLGAGDYLRMSAIDTSEVFATNRNHSLTFALGSRTGWTGKRVRFFMQVASSPSVTYVSSGIPLTDWSYVSPSPSVQSASVNISRALTATGRAGPTDVGPCRTFWELEVTAGEVFIVGDERTNVDLSVQTDITDTFTIPPNFTLAGKLLRFCVRPNADAAVVYRSTGFALSDPVPTTPSMTVTAAACSLGKLLTASVNLGTSNAGPATGWWEIQHELNEWESVLDRTAGIVLTSTQTRNLSYQFPNNRFSLAGYSIRYALQSQLIPEVIWYSSPLAITQTLPISPAPTLAAAAIDAFDSFTANGSLEASNLGQVTVTFEVQINGEFTAVMEPQTVTLSPSVSTPVSASVVIPGSLVAGGTPCRLVARSVTFPELSYQSSPVNVVQAGATSPALAMTVASQTAGGTVTLQGTIGATDITSASVWFEVAGVTGSFDGIMGKQTGVNISAGMTFSATVVAGRTSLNGRSVRLAVSPTASPENVYYSTGQAITEATYTNPLPAITSAAVSAAGVFAGVGAAGPSDIGAATTWWEVEYTTGEFTALLETAASPDMSVIRQTINASVTLPSRFDLTGKNVRLAVRQNSRPDNVWYSALVALNVTPLTPPSMNITSASVTLASLFTASATLGANNLGTVRYWWEVEVTAGEFVAMFDPVSSFALPAGGTTLNANSPLPTRFDLNGKTVRLALSPVSRGEIVYYSSAFPIAVENLTDPQPQITAITVSAFGDVAATVRAGPTNAAQCRVWWEVGNVATGFRALFQTEENVNLFSQQFISRAFTMPRGEFNDPTGNYNYASKQLQFAVQPNNRPESVFYSPGVSVALAARDDANALIESANALVSGAATFTGTAGPSNLGMCVARFEIWLPDGVVSLGELPAQNIAGTTVTFTDTFQIPLGWDLTSAILKLVVTPIRDRLSSYYSPDFPITGENFNRGAPPSSCNPTGVKGKLYHATQPLPAYSGPITLFSENMPVANHDVVLDGSASGTITLSDASLVESDPGIDQVTLVAGQSTTLLEAADPGIYTVVYEGGAIASQGVFNAQRRDDYDATNPASGLFLLAGSDPESAIPVPGFKPLGFTSAAAAEAASQGLSLTFYHPGGDLKIVSDDATITGSARIRLVSTPRLAGRVEWVYLGSAGRLAPPNFQRNTNRKAPTIENLVPGEHTFECRVLLFSGGVVARRHIVRVWADVPRRVDGKDEQVAPRYTLDGEKPGIRLLDPYKPFEQPRLVPIHRSGPDTGARGKPTWHDWGPGLRPRRS